MNIASYAIFNAFNASCAGRVGLGVEGDAFQGFGAVVAGEAVGMKALGRGADDAAFDGESAGGTLSGSSAGGWRPVQLG